MRTWSLPKLNLYATLNEEQQASEALLLSAAVWDAKAVGEIVEKINGRLLGGSRPGGAPAETAPRSQAEFEERLKNV